MVVSSVTVRSAVVDTIVGVGTTMRWVDTSSMDAKSAWTPVVNFLLLRQPYTQHRDVPGKLCVQGKCREGNNVHNVWLAHFEAESVQRFDVIPRWSADGTRHAPCEMPILAGADQMLPNHIYHFLRDFDVNRYLGVPRKVRAVHIDFVSVGACKCESISEHCWEQKTSEPRTLDWLSLFECRCPSVWKG